MASPLIGHRMPVRLLTLLTRPDRDRRVATAMWGLSAILALVAGVTFADHPLGSEAFFEVRKWLTAWQDGTNVYGVKLDVDYPPNALVFLRPLLWFPNLYWWAALNVVLCCAAAWMLVSVTARLSGVRLSRLDRLPFVLMLITWAPGRVGIWNGQTTSLMILACAAALRIGDARPILGGILLGIGASKPHLAFGFVLVTLFRRQWRLLVAAGVTVSLAVMAYCATVDQTPVEVLTQYLNGLFGVYGGSTFLRGEVDARPLFVDAVGGYSVGESLYLAAAVALVGGVLWMVWRVRGQAGAESWVLAAGVATSLSIFPFRRYSLMLIAPAVLRLLWRPAGSSPMLTWALAGLVALLVVDVPFLARHTIEWVDGIDLATRANVVHYVHRFAVLACLAASIVALSRLAARRIERQ